MPADAAILARRFLHTNLNCTDIAASRAMYENALGLICRMTTEAEPVDGKLFGMSRVIHNDASFLYDGRGPRRICAIELIDWYDPPVYGTPYEEIDHVGLQSIGFIVGSLDDVEAALSDSGAEVVGRINGPAPFIDGSTGTILARDLDGVNLEIVEVPGHPDPARSSRITATTTDIERSRDFYLDVGFAEVGRADITADAISTADRLAGVPVTAVEMRLPDDEYSLVLLGWPAGTVTGSVYPDAYHRGLFRVALAVDEIAAAREAMPADIIDGADDPIWCEMPGTPLGGLFVQFLSDPDGITVELVERARNQFKGSR